MGFRAALQDLEKIKSLAAPAEMEPRFLECPSPCLVTISTSCPGSVRIKQLADLLVCRCSMTEYDQGGMAVTLCTCVHEVSISNLSCISSTLTNFHGFRYSLQAFAGIIATAPLSSK